MRRGGFDSEFNRRSETIAESSNQPRSCRNRNVFGVEDTDDSDKGDSSHPLYLVQYDGPQQAVHTFKMDSGA